MRIPSGDLSPARHRRYGGSYGRRRRRTLRGVLVLILLLVIAGAGTYLLRNNDATAPAHRQVAGPAGVSPTSCGTGSTPAATPAAVALPAPSAVRLVLLNGTPRNGLGKSVGAELAARGFTVAGTGNAPRPQAGPSVVVFGPGGQPAALLLSRFVLGSTMTGNAKAARDSVQVVLGTAFTRLRTPAEVAALGSTAPVPVQTAAACQ